MPERSPFSVEELALLSKDALIEIIRLQVSTIEALAATATTTIDTISHHAMQIASSTELDEAQHHAMRMAGAMEAAADQTRKASDPFDAAWRMVREENDRRNARQ